ncbi:MAG: methyl-accepting chemotaxis protein [Lachnospiraceae bacterium]|nr:methyl-accepting chemotaxis protein [Lachnospiraceae bacterium]
MSKKKNAGSFGEKVLNILKIIGSFFVFLKDKIVDFFVFLKDKIVDLWDGLMGKKDYRFGIRYKILLGFLIPLIFITIVGIVSYSKAKQGMRDRYEQSTLETVRMVGSQLDMITHFMQSEVSKYVGSSELVNLTMGKYDDSLVDKNQAIKELRTDLSFSQAVNLYISHIYILLKSDNKNISTKSSSITGFFDEYYESIEKSPVDGSVVKWIDTHPVLDDKMGLALDGGDAYVFSYQDVTRDNKAAIIIDAKKEKLQELLDGIDLGEDTAIGLVTMNGKELLHRNGKLFKDDGTTVFAGREYYKEVLNSGELFGIKEVSYNGKKCDMFYSVCDDSGIVITAMVPISQITAGASSIWRITIILVLIALAVVLGVAFLISNNIQKNVKNMSKGLGKVAEGDLTVKVRVDGHDEFKDLAGATTEMISNTKNLVSKVDVAAEGLAESAKEVQAVSKTLSDRSSSISRAVNEMSEGLEQQQKYADECVDTTERLSLEIKNVSSQISVIKKTIASINEMINESVTIAGSLEEKAKDTTEANHSVKKSVMALVEETEKINDFVNVIKSISSQTHLLSLNASIEAARAGEAGRGFSVVAEEIRNLATESTKSAGEIQKLVDGINRQTDSSAESVDAARSIADEQFELVNRSKSIFDSMKQSMDSLNEELGNIDTATEAADLRREEAVGAVGDISDIISRSTSNTENVKQILDRLKKDIDNLDKTAARLGESMDGLKNEVRVFRI